MSEPKGPPVLDEGTARRPSKKASGSKKAVAPSAGDATAASPGPSAPSASPASAQAAGPPTVPRIPLATAEPKATAQGDAKPRASKKRTSVAAADPSGPPPSFEAATGTARAATMGPTSVAPDAAITVAKAEADAAAAARREAKKQRARELEEQKRREELERRAAEEQRRLEEQRKREERQRQQQAALNANAEECQEEAEEQNEYEDDGFENDDDDGFEADESSAPPKPAVPPLKPMSAKAHAKSRGSTSQAGGGDLTGRELEKIQHALQAESKELLSTSRPSSSSAPDASRSESASQPGSKSIDRSGSAASSTISSSIAGLKQALDPRAKCVKAILEARKSLDVDKFQLFQQNPVSEQDKLMQRLRRGAVRQGIVQTSEGARAQATQTKPPPSADKSMHFPDDIGLESSSAASLSARNTSAGDNNAEEQATASTSSSLSSSSRFFKFLEHAAYACEVLVVENTMAAEKSRHDQAEAKSSGNEDDSASQSKEGDVVSVQKRFEVTSNTPVGTKLVCPVTNESKETEPLQPLQQALRGRSLAALHFSPVVSNLVLACYVDDGAVDDESKADSKRTDGHDKEAKAVDRHISYHGKTLSCVWDVNQPSRPLHVLKNEGAASAAMLSPSRELFVLAGSTDGSIYVWDLRQNALMAAQSTPILMDGVAVCAPIYSTCGASVRVTDRLGQSHSQQQEHHSSAVVSIEPIVRATSSSSSSVAGGNFQFGSMDDRGVLIVWSLVELDADDEALVANKCAEIGARVKLVMNARIDTQRMYIAPPPSNLPANGRRSSGSSSTFRKGSLGTDAKSAALAAKSTQMLSIGPIASVIKFLPHDPNQLRPYLIVCPAGVAPA